MFTCILKSSFPLTNSIMNLSLVWSKRADCLVHPCMVYFINNKILHLQCHSVEICREYSLPLYCWHKQGFFWKRFQMTSYVCSKLGYICFCSTGVLTDVHVHPIASLMLAFRLSAVDQLVPLLFRLEDVIHLIFKFKKMYQSHHRRVFHFLVHLVFSEHGASSISGSCWCVFFFALNCV